MIKHLRIKSCHFDLQISTFDVYQLIFLSFLKFHPPHIEFDILGDAHGPGGRFKVQFVLLPSTVAEKFDFSMCNFWIDVKRGV